MEAMRSTWTDERLDDGFRRVDQRFDEVDRRFDEMDRRFDRVEKRVDLIQAELVELRVELSQGFAAMNKTLARLGFGLGFSMFFVLLTAFLAAR